MEIFITIIGTLIAGIPLVVSLIIAFCMMFDDVFGTYLTRPFINNNVWIKGLAISGMLLILSSFIIGIWQLFSLLK